MAEFGLIAFFAAMIVGCGALGYWAAQPGASNLRIGFTLIAAWLLGSLVIGIPAHAAGWIIARRKQRSVQP